MKLYFLAERYRHAAWKGHSMTKNKIYFGGFAVTVGFQLKRLSCQGAQGRFPFLLAVGFSDGKGSKLPLQSNVLSSGGV